MKTLGRGPHERLLEQKLEAVQAGMPGHQRQLERPRRNLLRQLWRAFARHRHLDHGMLATEAAEDVGEIGLRIVVRNAEPHRAAQAVARQGGHSARFDLHDAAGEVDQALALGRQPRAPALLDEQGAAELLLEPAHVHRHGRLGLVDPLGGPW